MIHYLQVFGASAKHNMRPGRCISAKPEYPENFRTSTTILLLFDRPRDNLILVKAKRLKTSSVTIAFNHDVLVALRALKQQTGVSLKHLVNEACSDMLERNKAPSSGIGMRANDGAGDMIDAAWFTENRDDLAAALDRVARDFTKGRYDTNSDARRGHCDQANAPSAWLGCCVAGTRDPGGSNDRCVVDACGAAGLAE